MRRLKVRTNERKQNYEILIGRGLLSASGQFARECLGEQTRRLTLISNRKVYSLYGKSAIKSLRAHGFAISTCLIGDGEQQKSLKTLEKILNFLSKNGNERTDGLVALGGGVVGDITGFAAAVYLRGVRYLQIPTTLLSQIDSSVGGKTAVNLASGKNRVGSFHQPCAVIVDVETLATLPARELAAGCCECVKQAAVGNRRLFDSTVQFLKHRDLDSTQLEQLIADHCAFKTAIVAGDEREDPNRRDHRSRRILNFGHTVGHAIEAVTDYKSFRHGEAVGHGMLVAGELSKIAGLLDQSELELLRQGVSLCGPLPPANHLDVNAMVKAIAHDKKRTSGEVQWVLLESIGRPRIVDGAEITPAMLRRSLRQALQ